MYILCSEILMTYGQRVCVGIEFCLFHWLYSRGAQSAMSWQLKIMFNSKLNESRCLFLVYLVLVLDFLFVRVDSSQLAKMWPLDGSTQPACKRHKSSGVEARVCEY